mgnify:CR=1 FL=1
MSEKQNGLGWSRVTAPQRTEKALEGWRTFLVNKGVEVRVVKEGNGFTLQRWGKDYFDGAYQP